jgi:propanol-preferring alcohol dehydrogenase
MLSTKEPTMTTTYRAVQVSKPGRLDVVERELPAPPPGKVRIRVEACGVCHSDSATVDGIFPDVTYPRVPGHEAVGRIDALGDVVQGWSVGQRVGVGFLGGSCGYCHFCRNGDLVNCRNQEYTGIHRDGGYAEVMTAKSSGLVSVADDMSSAGAAPLLSAGLTTFRALRNARAKAGDRVAVLGIGGLLGLFAGGDVRHYSVKRCTTAVAEGATAVSMVHRFLALKSQPTSPPLGPRTS